MSKLQNIALKILSIGTAVICGFSLSILLFSLVTNASLFNSSYHKWLFKKSNIYGETFDIVEKSMSGFIKDLRDTSPQNYNQHRDIFDLLEKSVTRELVYSNLDILRDGLFDYFKGESRFLPDIKLNTPDTVSGANSSEHLKAIGQIKKVNLGAILMYVNRSDINNYLDLIRLISIFFSRLAGFCLLIVFLLFLTGLSLSKKPRDMVKWLCITFLASGILSLILTAALYIYTYFALPDIIYPLTMSLPLSKTTLIKYSRGMLTPLLICLPVTCVINFLIYYGLKRIDYILNLFRGLLQSKKTDKDTTKNQIVNRKSKIFKNAIYMAVAVLVFSSVAYRLYLFRQELEKNKLSTVFAKLNNTYEVTKVIPAKDAAVYILELRLKERSAGLPASDTYISVNGVSSITGKAYSTSQYTDKNGKARFELDKGTYRLGFIPEFFPVGFEIPSPFHLELRSPGTTVVTINLDRIQPETMAKGVAELEILNEMNIPVEGIKLYIENSALHQEDPGRIFSVTNQDGIAVFNLYEGSYTIGFDESSFPDEFVIPSHFEIIVEPDISSRLTFQLVSADKTDAISE